MAYGHGSCLLFITHLVFYVTSDDIVLLTPAQRQEILDAHNHFRRLETSANNMRLMRWDCELEAFAIEWLLNCRFAHSPQSMRKQPKRFGFRYVGENLLEQWHSSPNANLPKNLTAAHKGYYDEVKDYSYSTNRCRPGKQCGHYTQVVWADSYTLGCGLTRCPSSDSRFKSHAIMSCIYGPGGNIGGQKPYKKGGGACSGCVNRQLAWGSYCIKGLCSDTASPPPLPQCVRQCPASQPRCFFSTATVKSSLAPECVLIVLTLFLNSILPYLP